MFGANSFGWPYFAEAYAGAITSTSTSGGVGYWTGAFAVIKVVAA